MVSGDAPQDCPLRAFNKLSRFLARVTMSLMCSSNVCFESKVTLRNLHDFSYFSSSPLSHNLGVLLFSFELNEFKTTVLSGFNLILHFVQKLSRSSNIFCKCVAAKEFLLL